jgi:hypothetical protein
MLLVHNAARSLLLLLLLGRFQHCRVQGCCWAAASLVLSVPTQQHW